jgi:uncharacterized membrane protein SpoIIM required for sporulation
MDSFIELLGLAVLGFCVALAVGLLQGLPVWLLWNALMPALFELPTLTFIQAVGLSVLCGCLFKSSVSSSK